MSNRMPNATPTPMSGLTRACLILFPFAYGLLALAYGQDANWDLRNYHWYNAYAFLNGRFGFDLLPSQTPYFYNPILDLPLFLLGTHFSAEVTSFALAFVQGLNFILLFTLARRVMATDTTNHNRNSWALLIAFTGLMGGGVLGELGTCFYDNIVSLGVLGTLSVLALRLGQADEGKHVRWWKWLLAGIPIGIVSGLKLPTTAFAVGVGLAFFLYHAPFGERIKRSALVATGMLFGFALGLGPWAVYLQSEFANPLFPYFNDLFLAPLAPAASARDMNFLPQGIEHLYFPLLFSYDPLQVGEVLWRDIKIALVFVLLPLVLLLRLRPAGAYNTQNDLATKRRTLVLLAGVISYGVWQAMFSIYRYAIPLEMLAALLLFLSLDMLRANAYTKKMVFLGLVLVCFASTIPADWGRVAHGAKYVEVKEVYLPEGRNHMVLMAGFQPYSHVIPAFPPEVPVIRIQSNFASPEEPKGINRIIKERVDAHVGPLWLLIPTYDAPWVAQKVLPQFGLKAKLKQCRVISNNLSEDLYLCPLSRP